MSLVSEQLPNLMNGVSQQAISMRLFSQAERQVNGFSSVVEGVNKRLPLKFLTKIIDGTAGDCHIHTINRDENERYIVLVFDGSIKVFDIDGNEKSVSYPDGTGYITTNTPSKDIRAITLADYTFIVNTSVAVGKNTGTLSPATPGEGQVFIRAVNYDTTYKVLIDGVEKASYTTADAYSTNPKVSIGEVVDELTTQLQTNLTGFTVTGYSPVVHIEKDNGSDFTLEVTDSNGNTMTRAIYGKVQRFTDLPVVGKHGYIVQITGDDGSSIDDYYVKFEANKGNGFDSGVWVECPAPGIQIRLDPATMPHALVRKSNGDFKLEQVSWGDRLCGTEESAPWPSFVGQTIRDIFYDRNRLCFLSDDNVIMSRARSLFSFFRETSTTQLDTDPIDVVASGSKVSQLQYAVPFNKQVVIFSGQTQFVIDADTLIASEPPAVKEITAYEIDKQAKPVAVGKTIFFGVKSGSYSRMMEYFIVPETDTTDAADVSKHVPRYIPANLFKLAASPTDDVVFALTRDKPNRVYVYKFHWQGNQKLQSSWSYWEFRSDAVVLNVDFIGNLAYFVIQYGDAVYIETTYVSDGVEETDEPFTTRLDRLVDETQVSVSYNSGTNQTTLTLPYSPSESGMAVVTRPNDTPGAEPAYRQWPLVAADSSSVTVQGDLRAQKFYVGEQYTFEYEFTRPVLKSGGPSGGQASVLAGRLQINRWHVSYDRTGYFRAEVETANGGTYTYTFTGKILGTNSAVVNETDLNEGTYAFRVNTRADRVKVTIINDSFLPCYLTGAEWEGRFERRSSRA